MTLIDLIISMMTSRNVPKSFWPKVAKWETYVIVVTGGLNAITGIMTS